MSIKEFKHAVLCRDLTASLIYAQGIEDVNTIYAELDYCTPLTYSIVMSMYELTNALVAMGADVNTSDRNASPLQYSVMCRSLDNARLLLNNGAKASLMWRDPLTSEDRENVVPLAELMLNRGAHVNEQNATGDTPIKMAVHSCCLPLVEFLIEKGADLHLWKDDGMNLVHLASILGHSELIPVLHRQGISVNEQDKDGYTPLHHACDYDEVETVKVLLELGARANIRTRHGHLPYELNSNDTIRALLKQSVRDVV